MNLLILLGENGADFWRTINSYTLLFWGNTPTNSFKHLKCPKSIKKTTHSTVLRPWGEEHSTILRPEKNNSCSTRKAKKFALPQKYHSETHLSTFFAGLEKSKLINFVNFNDSNTETRTSTLIETHMNVDIEHNYELWSWHTYHSISL